MKQKEVLDFFEKKIGGKNDHYDWERDGADGLVEMKNRLLDFCSDRLFKKGEKVVVSGKEKEVDGMWGQVVYFTDNSNEHYSNVERSKKCIN